MTVLQNSDDLLPLKRLDTLNIALVSIGEQSNQFQQTLSNYAPLKTFHLSEQHSDKERKKILDFKEKHRLYLVQMHTIIMTIGGFMHGVTIYHIIMDMINTLTIMELRMNNIKMIRKSHMNLNLWIQCG